VSGASGQTPSQTVGPFFAFGLIRGGEQVLVNDLTEGPRIIVHGHVLDGHGVAIDDAMVEIWQADAAGIFNHPDDPRHGEADKHFRGWGRAGTNNPAREYWFKTVKPGPVPWQGGTTQAPHLNLRVFARGMLLHVLTRAYFSDESENAHDPILRSIADPERRQTLIAVREAVQDAPTYRMDIRLQGDRETVFFDP
jgi:protocatechuate 3,4-dioxygenase, alpha subunit